jgi:hypothetical protein
MGGTRLHTNSIVETALEFDAHDIHVIGIQVVERDGRAYGSVPTLIARTVTVEFIRTGRVVERCKLSDIPLLLREEGGKELSEQALSNPAGWAKLVAFLEDLGKVIEPNVRFEPLREKGYDLEQLSPRIEGNQLVFYVLSLDRATDDYVPKRVCWNTCSQQVVTAGKC